MRTENLDVIIVSETWLASEVYDSEIQLLGFAFGRVDRLNGRRRQGYSVYETHLNHTSYRNSDTRLTDM